IANIRGAFTHEILTRLERHAQQGLRFPEPTGPFQKHSEPISPARQLAANAKRSGIARGKRAKDRDPVPERLFCGLMVAKQIIDPSEAHLGPSGVELHGPITLIFAQKTLIEVTRTIGEDLPSTLHLAHHA